MKTFNNLEEMQPYYNEKTNTYEFIENQKMIDVEFDLDLNIDRNIKARDIKARDIDVRDIYSCDINSWNINARDINSCNINSWNINAWDINACNINSWNINARDINAGNINSWNINARDINAGGINALNIKFYAVCFAYETFVCNTVKGIRENAKYFCLDSDVIINKKED